MPEKATDRRDFPRLRASFGVRFAVCGHHGREVPSFTTDVSRGSFSFRSPDTRTKVGDHLSLEITVPDFDDPLFLGRSCASRSGWPGTTPAASTGWAVRQAQEKLEALISAHDDGSGRRR